MTAQEWFFEKIEKGHSKESLNNKEYYELFLEETGNESSYESYKRYLRTADQKTELEQDEVQSETLTTDNSLQINLRSYNIRTIDDLIKFAKVNMDVWKVNRSVVRASQNIHSPWYIVQANFVRKELNEVTPEDYSKRFLDILGKYKPIKYTIPKLKKKQTKVSEACIFDHHFGQLSWKPETGANYDIKIASSILDKCVDHFIAKTADETGQYIIPIGNDFFNCDNPFNQTYAGTPQVEDVRWQKTFYKAEELWIKQIDKFNKIAPVKIVIVPGNHDTTRTFYLGEFLSAWYRNNKSVVINNDPRQRKYEQIGNTLIGYTHGNKELKNSLPALMPQEEPTLFSQTKYHEWHLGHLHGLQEKNTRLSKESFGVTEIILPSLVAIDDWHNGKGYKHINQSMIRVYDLEQGLDSVYFFRV